MGAIATLSLLLLCCQFQVPKGYTWDRVVSMPDGTPAADARVALCAQGVDGATVVAETKTDAKGRFHMEYPFIWGRMPSFIAVVKDGCALSLSAAQTEPVSGAIALEPATAVHARFLDPLGKPAAGLLVGPRWMPFAGQIEPWSRLPKELEALYSRKTDAQGWATIEGMPMGTSMRLGFNDPRYVPPMPPSKFVTSRSETSEAPVFQLVPAGAIEGQVTGLDGKPAGGVRIEASSYSSACYANAKSDPQGRFSLAQLAAGTYVLSLGTDTEVLAPFTARTVSASVEAGKTSSGVKIVLERGCLLTGTAVDSDGEPAPNYFITFVGPLESQAGVTVALRRTDDAGRFAVRAVAGKYIANIIVGGQMNQRDVTIREGAPNELNLNVPSFPTDVEFVGRVVGPDGKPVPWAWVDSVDSGEPIWNSNSDMVQADAGGHFDVRTPERSRPRLRASNGKDCTTAFVLAVRGQETVLRLVRQATVSVSGRVLGSSGRPVGGATVQIASWSHGAGRATQQTTTDSEGRYRIDGFYPDEPYCVIVEAAGYSAGGTAWERLDGKDKVVAPIRLRRADSYLSGRVIDESGAPVAGAVVAVDSAQSSETDAVGRFRIEPVPAGVQTVSVRKGTRLLSAIVAAGQESALTMLAEVKVDQDAPALHKAFLRTGQPAPELEIADWLGSKATTLSALRGRIVVLDFWAFGSDVCRRRIPEMAALAKKLRGSPVTFIGIHVGAADRKGVMVYARQYGPNIMPAIDMPSDRTQGKTMEAYGFADSPAVVVIDQAGRIAAVPNSVADIESAIRSLSKRGA